MKLFQGIYAGKNCFLDMTSFQLLPMENYYWKVQKEIYKNDEIIMCTIINGQIVHH